MKEEKQVQMQWRLKLHGRELEYGRLRQDGTVGWAVWKIGEVSYWPMGFFIPFSSQIVNAVNKVHTKAKCFDTLRGPIRNTLLKASTLFGCTAQLKSRVRIQFLLERQRFAEFLIVDFQNHDKREFLQEPSRATGKQNRDLKKLAEQLRERRPEFKEMERKSRAMFRFAAVVLKDGLMWLVPAKTRED